ncbi:hypothetical protein [Actinoplanes siamensis]|uniref:hypothetical protein n=1 Tax=Actinoplanes siamensis TaxID=1223317 RepID=UPI001EF189EB|nr:hypothetical protein [Actinoplanes siamensis]
MHVRVAGENRDALAADADRAQDARQLAEDGAPPMAPASAGLTRGASPDSQGIGCPCAPWRVR